MPWELPAHLDADLVREGWNDLQTRRILRQTIVGVGDDRLKVTALETAWYMRNQLLRDTDWASMAHSLEVRVPFVDVHLFRAVVHLVRGGFVPTKREMASAPALPLPRSVLNRPKTGFSLPVREWLLDGRREVGRRCAHVRGLRLWALQVHERFCAATRAA
jgi:asparagine synthase (glutamine-hydrolysing)